MTNPEVNPMLDQTPEMVSVPKDAWEQMQHDLEDLKDQMSKISQMLGITAAEGQVEEPQQIKQPAESARVTAVPVKEAGKNTEKKGWKNSVSQKAAAAVLAAAGLFALGYAAGDDGEKANDPIAAVEEDGTTTTATEAETTTTIEAEVAATAEDQEVDPEAAINAAFPAFNGAIAVDENVDFSLNPHESGPNAFRNDTIESHQEHMDWLHSGDARANRALADVNAFLATHPQYAEGFWSGENLHFVQFKEAATIDGNSFYSNGARVEGSNRYVEAGDVWIMYVDDEGSVIAELSRRADCGNDDFDVIVPAPEKPDVPDIDEPVEVPEETTTTTIPEEETTTTTEEEEEEEDDEEEEEEETTTTTTLPEHDPADGPPPEATIPGQPQPATEGYEPGRAEDVVDQQEGETPGGVDPTEHGTPAPEGSPSGPDQVVSEPGEDAPGNPDHVPGSESEGTDEGISNDPNGEDAETDQTDETADNGDLPLDPLAGAGILLSGSGLSLGLGAEQDRRKRIVSAPKGMPAMDIPLEEK